MIKVNINIGKKLEQAIVIFQYLLYEHQHLRCQEQRH